MSNKKQSKRENIIALISCGFTDTEIADTLHISAQSGYIRKVRRSLAESVPEESSQDSGKPKLTPERYYNAIMKPHATKEELAAELGVSNRTLHYFEADSEIKKRVAEFMYMDGMSIDEISARLVTRKSALEEMGIISLPTLPEIKKQLEQILDRYQDAAEWDSRAAAKYYHLKNIFDRLK